MDEVRFGVPADAAALHRAGFFHRLREPRRQVDVERPAVEMLAVLGNPEGRRGKHRVGCRGAVGRQHDGLRRADRRQDIAEEIEDADIDRDLGAGMEIAQQMGKVRHRVRQPSERSPASW